MHSKTDLSAEYLKLDYDDLVRVSEIALSFTQEQLHRELDRWYFGGEQKTVSPVYSDSMLRTARALRDATVLHYYLINGADREVVTVIKEEQDAQPAAMVEVAAQYLPRLYKEFGKKQLNDDLQLAGMLVAKHGLQMSIAPAEGGNVAAITETEKQPPLF